MPFSKRLCIHRDSVSEIIVKNIRLPEIQCDRESRFPRIQCDRRSGFSGLKETAEADFSKLSHNRGLIYGKPRVENLVTMSLKGACREVGS
jgi:hypothetical protein